MKRRLWFDLPATVLHAEHALSRSTGAPTPARTATGPMPAAPTRTRPAGTDAGFGIDRPALILRDGPSPLLAGNGIPMLHATPPATAAHTDVLTTRTAADTGAVRAGTYRLPLAARSPLLGIPLRDLLRHGMHAGHAWFTIDVDPNGLRAVATQPVRDLGDPPAAVTWCAAWLTVDGLGTYPGRTCPGYRLGGDLARFQHPVLQRLLADTGCSHTDHSPVFTVIEDGQTWLVDTIGDRTPVTDDGDGWWRVAHPALPWTAAPITVAGPQPVFEPCGPDGDLVRCGVCGAVEEITYYEVPWPSGARVDTTRTCTICGSWEDDEAILGWHRQPWPPSPEHALTEGVQR